MYLPYAPAKILGCEGGFCSAEINVGQWVDISYGDGICVYMPEVDGADVDCDDDETTFAG